MGGYHHKQNAALVIYTGAERRGEESTCCRCSQSNDGGEVLLRRFGENTQEELQIINKLVATSQQYQRLQEEREILAQTKRKKIVRISNDKGVDIAVSDADIQEQISVFDDEIKEFMTSPMTSKHKNSILLINQDLHELEVSDLDNDRKSKRIQRLWLAVLFG